MAGRGSGSRLLSCGRFTLRRLVVHRQFERQDLRPERAQTVGSGEDADPVDPPAQRRRRHLGAERLCTHTPDRVVGKLDAVDLNRDALVRDRAGDRVLERRHVIHVRHLDGQRHPANRAVLLRLLDVVAHHEFDRFAADQPHGKPSGRVDVSAILDRAPVVSHVFLVEPGERFGRAALVQASRLFRAVLHAVPVEDVETVAPEREEVAGHGAHHLRVLEVVHARVRRNAVLVREIDELLEARAIGQVPAADHEHVEEPLLHPLLDVEPGPETLRGRVHRANRQEIRLAPLGRDLVQAFAHVANELVHVLDVRLLLSELEEERMPEPVQLHAVEIKPLAAPQDEIQEMLAHLGLGPVEPRPVRVHEHVILMDLPFADQEVRALDLQRIAQLLGPRVVNVVHPDRKEDVDPGLVRRVDIRADLLIEMLGDRPVRRPLIHGVLNPRPLGRHVAVGAAQTEKHRVHLRPQHVVELRRQELLERPVLARDRNLAVVVHDDPVRAGLVLSALRRCRVLRRRLPGGQQNQERYDRCDPAISCRVRRCAHTVLSSCLKASTRA